MTAPAPVDYLPPLDAAGQKYPNESLEASEDEALAKILQHFETNKKQTQSPRRLLLKMYEHGALPNGEKTFEWGEENTEMQSRTMRDARDILKEYHLIDTEVSTRIKKLNVPRSKTWKGKAKTERYHSPGRLTTRGVRAAEHFLRSPTKKLST